jgi:hypothetical protein
VTFANCHFDHFSYSGGGAQFLTIQCGIDGATFSDFFAVCLTRAPTISWSLLPPSAAFQQSLSWWQSERGFRSFEFAFSPSFSRSVSVGGTSRYTQSRVSLPSDCFFVSGSFPGSPTFRSSQSPIESGSDSNTVLKAGSVVGMVVGGMVIIAVIITLVV